MTHFERIIPLSGIHNFRDYGGYQARDGRIRRGLLWRSGQHGEATPDDLERVHELGIATVIDLRGDSERANAPCLRHGAFDGAVLFHPGETGSHGRAVHEEMTSGVTTSEDARAAMTRLYKTMPWRPVLVGTYRLYFAALAERDGASLLHCLAGKDRTGVAAALLHSLLGVHHDDLMADYLLTNTAGDSEKRIEAGARHLRKIGLDENAVRVFMGVEPVFLDTALTQIAAQHGSVERYAADVLGVTPQIQQMMIEQLVE